MSKTTEQMELITCIDSILDKLQLLVPRADLCKYDRALYKLKVELRLVKTFLLCYWKLGYSWCYFQHSVHEFYSLLLRFEDDGLPPSDLAGSASKFGDILKSSKQEISGSYVHIFNSLMESVSESRIRWNTRDFDHQWRWYSYWSSESYRKRYSSMLDRLLESSPPLRPEFMESSSISTEESVEPSSPPREEFMEFFHSLLQNLADILNWAEACDSEIEKLLEPLQEKLVFLKNFILFARLQGKPERKLMEHCGVVTLSAAHLCYDCWFFRDDNEVFDGINLKIDEVKEKIRPVVEQVRLDYIGILESGSSSLRVSTKTDMSIVGDFVDSLLGNLWEFLVKCPTWFTLSLKHQIRILYEGLRFLRSIMMKQREDYYDGLPGRIKDLIGAVVSDAGIVIFSLYQDNIREASAKEIDLKLFCLLEKIKLVQAEIEKKYPVASRFKFPTTNALELIDLLEKLKELESYEVDPTFFAKDRVDFLNSYLKKTVEHPSRYPEQKLSYPYKTSWVIDVEQQIQLEKLQHNLEQCIKSEKHQHQTMKIDLESLRSLLEENGEQHNQQVQHEDPHALWSRVIKVAYEAEFVIESFLVGDISFYSLTLFDDIAREIKLVKSLAQEATKNLRHVTKTSQARSKSSGASHKVPSQGNISTINEAVVALKDQEEAIINKLIRSPKDFDIISIVGMAGLGKTFLAQKVYHHSSVASHFRIRAWCCISQTYCKKDLLLQILACIDQKAQFSKMDEYNLALRLKQDLKRQRYLIVLDDVWGIEAWNALKDSFPNCKNRSRLLLTSRVTDIIGTPYDLRKLNEPESWELLQKKLAVIREGGYPPEQNVLGRQIAKNCNGLPLSIVIISGILSTLDQVGWEEVAKNVRSNTMVGATEKCSSLLELSYIHLPDHLKRCLLYFAAFQEDQEICVRRLTWSWIAEGFVQKNESECLEKTAEGYVMALINRSLVMVGQKRSAGGVKTCRIHDLLHVFCVGKARDQNFLQSLGGNDKFLTFDKPYHPRRLAIHSQPKHFIKSRIICPHIRSLLYSSRDIGIHPLSCNFRFIFLLKFLRVLNLENISLGLAFPSELWLLIQLRYLAVLGRLKNDIPSSLEKLSNLETFLVRTKDDFGLSLLQGTLLKMQKLRHLHVHGALIDLRLANDDLESSSILNDLDTISTIKLYLGQSMEKMTEKFPNIRQLKCCLVESEGFAADRNRVVIMKSLRQLESLKLNLGKVTIHCVEFQLPSSLKKLTLEEFSWSIISTIRKLSNLQVLRLLQQADGEDSQEMEDMEYNAEREDMEEEEFFPKLKFLKLKSLKIVRWRGLGNRFPCLAKLVLDDCKKLQELPSCLGESPLELIEVHQCPDLDWNLIEDIEKQQSNGGNEDLKIHISDEVEDNFELSDEDLEGWS